MSPMQPEAFYTINAITGLFFGPLSVTSILGVLFIAALITFHFVSRRKKKMEITAEIFFKFLAVFTAPLLLVFFLSSLYDFQKDFSWLGSDIATKREKRICAMDQTQGLNGLYCGIFPFMAQVKNEIPDNAEIAVRTYPGVEAYFNYFLFPNYRHSYYPEYIVFYEPTLNDLMGTNNRPSRMDGYLPSGYEDWELAIRFGEGIMVLKRKL